MDSIDPAGPRAAAHDESFVAIERDGLTFPFGERVPGPGELVPVAPGIGWGRLPIPGPLRHVNVLALEDGDGVAIVDTGFNTPDCHAGWAAILAGPLAGRAVTRVIATHCHPDHVGLAGWFHHQWGAPVWMTRGEWLTIRLMAADARDAVPAEQVALWRGAGWSDAQIEAASAQGYSRMRRMLAPLPLGYRRIVEGEVVAVGDRRFEVVVGSGHSPEHACLLDRANGLLIAGDQVLPRISSNVSLGAGEPWADPLGEWLASLAKLKTLPAGLLVLPGHGEPFHGLHDRCTALEEEHAGRLAALTARLAEPARVVDCFPQLFRRPIGDDVLGMATGEALAHLRHLEIKGRVARDAVDGTWWWRQT